MFAPADADSGHPVAREVKAVQSLHGAKTLKHCFLGFALFYLLDILNFSKFGEMDRCGLKHQGIAVPPSRPCGLGMQSLSPSLGNVCTYRLEELQVSWMTLKSE